MTPEEALRGALMWLDLMIEAADIDPEDTHMKVTIKGKDEPIKISLHDAMERYGETLLAMSGESA